MPPGTPRAVREARPGLGQFRASDKSRNNASGCWAMAVCNDKRQLEGIAKAKAAGVYKGRQASIDRAQVQRLKAEGMGPSRIAKHLGIGRTSVYRALED